MSNRADDLKRSEECAYLEERIALLRGALGGIRLTCTIAPPEVTKKFAQMTLDADDARRHGWEHSGLNEQP